MSEKIFTVGLLRVIIQNDLKEFVRLLIYHKENNIPYFNRILLPFYIEQKSLGKIPKAITDFIEENKIAVRQIEINPIEESPKGNKIIQERANTETKQDIENNIINHSEHLEQEKKTSNELNLIARSNFKLFKTLSDSYYEQDKEYYESVVLPILNYHQKRLLEKGDNKSKKEEGINKAHKRILVYGGIICGIILLIISGYFYVNNKLEEAEKRNRANEEMLRKEFEEKNEKTKRETEQKIRDEYTRREESNRQMALEQERKKKLEEEKTNESITNLRNKDIKDKTDKWYNEFNKLKSIEQELVMAAVKFTLAKEIERQMKYNLNYNTTTNNLQKKANEYEDFIKTDYSDAINKFGRLVSDYSNRYGVEALLDLSIKFGFRNLIN